MAADEASVGEEATADTIAGGGTVKPPLAIQDSSAFLKTDWYVSLLNVMPAMACLSVCDNCAWKNPYTILAQ